MSVQSLELVTIPLQVISNALEIGLGGIVKHTIWNLLQYRTYLIYLIHHITIEKKGLMQYVLHRTESSKQCKT